MFCQLLCFIMYPKNVDVHEKPMNCKKTGTVLIPVTATQMLSSIAGNRYSYNMIVIKGPISKSHEKHIP